MGKGRNNSKDDRAEHASRPLSSLKDPASFGPPPKRSESRVSSVSSTSVSNSTHIPTLRPLGAALRPEEIVREPEAIEEKEQEQGPPPPPLPYRANRTGLTTEHLPPPPVRRTASQADQDQTVSRPTSQARPNVPPRLPTRNTISPSPSPPPPPYSIAGQSIQLNPNSMNRLEQAGVSVPALGIGGRSSDQNTSTSRGPQASQVNELQARFAKMSASGTPTAQLARASTDHSISQRRNDNVSTSPASRTDAPQTTTPLAPSSMNNFRQRSNEHIETGKQKLSAFNQKHRITERIGSYFNEQPRDSTSAAQPPPPPPPPHPNLSRQGSNIDLESLNKRKPPPPPPPAKKPGLKSTPVNGGDGSESPTPPPLPLETKPR